MSIETVNSNLVNFSSQNHKLFIAETYSNMYSAIDETYNPSLYPIWYRTKRIFKRNTAAIPNVHAGTKEGYLSWFHRMEISNVDLNIGSFANSSPNYIQYLFTNSADNTNSSFTTTFKFPLEVHQIQWTVSRPDLVEIVTVKDIDPSISDLNYKGIVIKENITSIASGTSLGNLTGTLTVDGISITRTIPIIAGQTYPVQLTGSQPITHSEDDPNYAIASSNSKYYSINNSNTWKSLTDLISDEVNVGSQIKFKCLFSGSGRWNFSITSNDHPGLNTQSLDVPFNATLITPNVTVTGPVSVLFKAVKL